MTIIRRHTVLLTLGLLAFSMSALAQTPSIEVSTDTDAAEFSARGETRRVQVEVYAPSGELVFETDDSDGQSIRWPMVNQRGERVPDGVYLATITVIDPAGKRRKRIEQITVASPQPVSQPSQSEQKAATPQAGVTPEPNASGSGTAGKIPKWVDNIGTLGNSIVTEGAGRIGVNISPSATLHVSGPQPAPLGSNGTNAVPLLQTAGGSGGNTTGTTGQTAGAGAGIALYAGNGGTAPLGGKNGNGGNIVLQPGSAGGGAGAAGASGNVFVVPSGVGNMSVGGSSAPSRLTVNGNIQILGPTTNGIKFADGSIQTKATSGTINGTGTTNRLAKFTGPNSFGNSSVTEVSGKVGIGTASPVTPLDVRGNLTLDAGGSPTLYTSSVSGEQNRYLQLINSPSSPSASGLKAGGILVSDSYAYADPGKNDLVVKGNVGIGTDIPTSRLTVVDDISTAIYASGNPAISASGDTIQSSDSFGGVKAMVRIQGDGSYVLCYNGATGARTGSGCGFTVTSAGGSLYNINFGAGIDVQHRFFSLSGSSTIVVFGFPGSNTLQVNVGNTSPNFAYYIIAY
jgi:hypothetical protein